MTRSLLPVPESLNQESGRVLFDTVRAERRSNGSVLALDLSKTASMDSFGGAWLVRIAEHMRQYGGTMEFEGATGDVAEFMVLLEPGTASQAAQAAAQKGAFEQFCDGVVSFFTELREFLVLCVDSIYWTMVAPLEGRGLRFGALMDEMYEMGVRAVRIVFLMNFLLGLIIAMLSAKQVEAFGIQIYVANLIVIAFGRELAAVMTAVVVSARTGAAIASEISTMKVQEEIDALRGMGLNVAQYLVAPKLLALVIVLPCLTVLGMVAGTLGGSVWGVAVLGFRPFIWYEQTLSAADMSDITQGLLKSLCFAVAIALIGCHNGFRVEGGSRGVGRMTTRAVVMDIFMLIVIDIIFATIFYYILD